MAYKDKDEFLDALYEHLELEDNDEDQSWFAEKVEKFFEQFDSGGSDNSNSGSGGRGANSPRRRSRSNSGSGGPSRRRSRASTSAWWG